MLQYAYIHIEAPLDPVLFSTFLRQLPEAMQQKTLRFRRWQDQNNHLFGKLLLERLLVQQFHQAEDCLLHLHSNEFGKPLLNDQIHFNISHSDQMVVCMVSDEGPVGIDVERRKDFQVEDIKTFLRPEEFEALQNDPTSEKFFDFWTKKEAILKATGLGLTLDLKKVGLHGPKGYLFPPYDEWWHFHQLDLHPGYTTTYCTREERSTAQHIPLAALSAQFSRLEST